MTESGSISISTNWILGFPVPPSTTTLLIKVALSNTPLCRRGIPAQNMNPANSVAIESRRSSMPAGERVNENWNYLLLELRWYRDSGDGVGTVYSQWRARIRI